MAIEEGADDVVSRMLSRRDVRIGGAGHWTAVHAAAFVGNIAAVRMLLDHNVDMVADGHGRTPFAWACRRGQHAVVELLLQHYTPSDLQSALVLAARSGSAETVQHVLSAGATAGAAADGFLPVVEAARLGHDAVVELLLEAGADAEHRDASGMSAMAAQQKKRCVTICLAPCVHHSTASSTHCLVHSDGNGDAVPAPAQHPPAAG